jgi:hypothetical protein
MQQNLPKLHKIAQNCPKLPKLPKFAQRQLVPETLKYHQKLRFWCFSEEKKLLYVEGIPKHVHTVWIFNIRIFHMPFPLSKNGLCM